MDIDVMECPECGLLYNYDRKYNDDCVVCKERLRPIYLDVNED